MRCEPVHEISGRKLVGGEIELKYTGGDDAMPWRPDRAAPVSASGARGKFIHSHLVRSKSQGRRGNLNRYVQAVHLGAHVAQLRGAKGGWRNKPLPGPGD